VVCALVVGAVLVGAAATASATHRLLWSGVAAALLVLAWSVRFLNNPERHHLERHDPERWLRGAAGESATAHVLYRLPSRRWAVLHDRRIPGSRANLDHIVVGPTGVWLLDTKTTRAPVRARWRSVRLGDRPLDTGPTRWEAQVVSDRLGTDVQPLVVLHGHELRRRGVRCDGVRVVPPCGLLRRLRRGRRRLSRAQVAGLAARADAIFGPASSFFKEGLRSGG
jgi:hypothetical protein